MDGPTDDAATEPLEPSELLEPLNTLPTAHSALPGVHPDPRPLAPLPQPLPPLPPGLPPLEPRQHLLWWQGASAMVLAVVILLIANVGAGLLVLLAQHGVSGVAGMGSANAEELITFPMLAAGQVANLMAFLVVAALLPLVARVPHRSALGLGGAPASAFGLGALGILGLAPLADRIVSLLKPYFPAQSSLEMIEAAIEGRPLWLLVPFLAVMPALGEELLCRGVLQRSIRTPWVAILVSAVFFAGLHFDPLHVAGVLPLGFYLAWLGHRTGSVWVPVTAHFANNLAATLAMYFVDSAPGGVAGADAAELPLAAVPVGLLVTAMCAYGLHVRVRPNNAPESSSTPAPEALA